MISKYHLFVLLLCWSYSNPYLGLIPMQNDYSYSKTNLIVLADHSYVDEIHFIREATYEISSRISPTHDNITVIALSIKLTADIGSLEFNHRADTSNRTVDFIPLSEMYTLNITNTGYIDSISVNFTVRLTSLPSTSDQTYLIRVLIVSFGVLVILPVALIITSLLVYKNRRLTRNPSTLVPTG